MKNEKVDEYIHSQEPWKKEKLQSFRRLIHSLNGDVEEQFKWNVPVFAVNGQMRISMAAFKNHVKYNFFIKNVPGYSDSKLFNNGFDSETFRSIDVQKDNEVDAAELEKIVAEFLRAG